MAERLSIEELSRQPLVRGTSAFTKPDGVTGYKTEDIQASALVRIAATLEQLAATATWLSVSVALPAPRPNSRLSWAVLAAEYTGSQVLVCYNHLSGQWEGLDYQPRITHWQPLPKSPKHEEGGQADG
jgi:hypothetical protein